MFTEESKNRINTLIELKKRIESNDRLQLTDLTDFCNMIPYEKGEDKIRTTMVNRINAEICNEFESSIKEQEK